jgi:hypothetical protein
VIPLDHVPIADRHIVTGFFFFVFEFSGNPLSMEVFGRLGLTSGECLPHRTYTQSVRRIDRNH